jgi:uncharacterized membrane protein YphA (DoxX/SURF4 family)
MGLFRLLARATIGLLFVGHGTQKLFGWFGGGGPEGTGQFFEQVGLRPGRQWALAAGAAEAGGGLLFALGAATPLAAAAVSGSMITAIKTVHWEKGVWVSHGGYEYNLVLLAAVFGLTENGPGKWSIDGASTPVTITASARGLTRTATLTVNPQPQTATLTVTATGRGGERVTSTPTGINVAVGSTGSASFPIGTAITLRATNERDVIWSGACSSGGNKTKTCTFTLNANASVTANVQ